MGFILLLFFSYFSELRRFYWEENAIEGMISFEIRWVECVDLDVENRY